MRPTTKLVATGGVLLGIMMAAAALAGPTGTPAANAVPTGKGTKLGGLFDSMVGRSDDGGKDADGNLRPRRKHLTSKEWHEAYEAKHGRALPSPLDRPGGH